jgi:hypothetical protein
MKINAKTRAKLNRSLGKLGLKFHDSPGLALSAVLEALHPEGVSFGLIFQPKTGRTRTLPKLNGVEVTNSLLVVETHHMSTGRVELNAYLS